MRQSGGPSVRVGATGTAVDDRGPKRGGGALSAPPPAWEYR